MEYNWYTSDIISPALRCCSIYYKLGVLQSNFSCTQQNIVKYDVRKWVVNATSKILSVTKREQLTLKQLALFF